MTKIHGGIVHSDVEPEFGESDARADELDPATLNKPTTPIVVAPPKILEAILGDLRAYSQLEPYTLLHADELTAQQVLNQALRKNSYYTADFALYTLEGTDRKKTPTLWLARHTAQEPNNLILNHLDDAVSSSFEQLTTGEHNYRPNSQEAQRVMQASSTLKIDLTQLRLQGKKAEYRFIVIDTTNYNQLNSEERKLAERFYGQGTDFDRAMITLKGVNINTTKVFVLNPAYVKKEATNPIGRAAWRDDFLNGADSDANVYDIDGGLGLVGVRRGTAAGGALQNSGVQSVSSAQLEYETAYNLIINHPELLNQDKAAGLSRILAVYLSAKK